MAYVYINDFCLKIKKQYNLTLNERDIYSIIYRYSLKGEYYGGFKYCHEVLDIKKSIYYKTIKSLKNKNLINETLIGGLKVANLPVQKMDSTVQKMDSNIILKNNKININKNIKPPIIPQGGNSELSPSDSFEIFFNKYPVKVDKDRCFKYWQNNFSLISKNINLIMNALDEQINSDRWKSESGKFIPYPLKWLRNKHWENIYPKAKTNEYTQSWTAEYRKELENL